MNSRYNAADIEVLSGLDPVKRRPGMYTDTARPNHLAQEVVDNAVDEALAGHADTIEVVLYGDGSWEKLGFTLSPASRQGGQFSYAISGIDPSEVYEAGGKLQDALMAHVGTVFAGPPLSDMYLKTPSLKIDILRDRASTYGVSATTIETQLRNAYSQNFIYLIKSAQDQY